MIDVRYADTFLKDLSALKSTPYYKKIKSICFDELPQCVNVTHIRNLKKMEGYKDFFRIRVGDYRIGLLIQGNSVDVLRVLNRKDIYKYFP